MDGGFESSFRADSVLAIVTDRFDPKRRRLDSGDIPNKHLIPSEGPSEGRDQAAIRVKNGSSPPIAMPESRNHKASCAGIPEAQKIATANGCEAPTIRGETLMVCLKRLSNRRDQGLALPGIPDLHGIVPAFGQDPLPVRAPGNPLDPAPMSQGRGKHFAG